MWKRFAVWMCPFAGGAATATYLTLKNLPFGYSDRFDMGMFFLVSFSRDTIANYLIALPLLLAVRWFYAKTTTSSYAVASGLAGLPVGYMLANPVAYAWLPTDADFTHGTYWLIMLTYMLCSCATGWLFSLGTNRPNNGAVTDAAKDAAPHTP